MLKQIALNRIATAALSLTLLAGTAPAEEGRVPKGVPRLDHVFVIMMENHGYKQIVGNPNAPFINHLAKSANTATNYYGIAHPSLTNYLEVVGGSNFGVHTDNYPDWHSTSCTPNLASGIVATDNPPSPLICPIAGTGTEADTPAIDLTNETTGLPGEINIDGVQSISARKDITGKTIADQLVSAGLKWKSYQESLPLTGADKVNVSDGLFTNNTDFTALMPTLNPPLTSASLVFLYAVKHNPFVYFRSVQDGTDPWNSLHNTVGFEGPNGLYADLAAGKAPAFSFIAPNQCNDQHGRGNAGAFCNFDPNDDGTQADLNPALIYRGDVTVQRLVNAIKASSTWKEQRSAIVVVWDENDYSISPTTNQVLLIVDTNYGVHGQSSARHYTHYSLTKTLDAAFRLPCLNHACDKDVRVMSDLFGHEGDDDNQ
jgi:hypothetical protein